MGHIKLDLQGKTFHYLTVIKFYKLDKNKQAVWECNCKCGKTKVYVSRNCLIFKKTKSCGCYNIELIKKLRTTHNMSTLSFYKIWQGIKKRCGKINDPAYKNYGGRGITYDPRWEEFLGFKKDMYQSYVFAKKKYRKELTKTNSLSIERIKNNGNYCKENCCWIPKYDQASNTRKNKWFEAVSPNGEIFTSNNQKKFCEKFKLLPPLVTKCLKEKRKTHNGWIFKYIDGGKNE